MKKTTVVVYQHRHFETDKLILNLTM